MVAQFFHSLGVVMKRRVASELIVDKSPPWGYFDNAYQNDNALRNIGGVLYFHDHHYIKLCANSGRGMNNVELLALQTLVKLTLVKHITPLQVFYNSSFAVKWIKEE